MTDNIIKIIIVGSGPSGLGIAQLLSRNDK